MIHIKYLEITNYRSCIKTKIEINTNLTTLIGINGVGKSNILNSIQLLKRINRNRFFHQKEFQESLSHSNLRFIINIDDQEYILKADIFFETDENNLDEIYSARMQLKPNNGNSRKWIEIDADLYEVVDRLRYMPKSQQQARMYEKYLGIEHRKLAVNLVTYLTNISYYSATQFSDPTKCPISLELEDSRQAAHWQIL